MDTNNQIENSGTNIRNTFLIRRRLLGSLLRELPLRRGYRN
jgi:hypothetical protein